ncbi:MAG: site-2 protease family protein [Puniceicoccales bacterium]|nr:site-2 protease family protein [Puniceicoccales bacterium]
MLALAVHEWGRAWMANCLGDDTPRIEGRLTLNPLAHVSFLGTLVFPLVIFLSHLGFLPIGWGRPVKVNSDNFKHKKWYDILSNLAGLWGNFILGFLILLLGFIIRDKSHSLSYLCSIGTKVNVAIGLFNLIPIPPLDGARILKVVIGIGEEFFKLFSKIGGIMLFILVNLPIFVNYFNLVNKFFLDFYFQFCKFLLG